MPAVEICSDRSAAGITESRWGWGWGETLRIYLSYLILKCIFAPGMNYSTIKMISNYKKKKRISSLDPAGGRDWIHPLRGRLFRDHEFQSQPPALDAQKEE